jgi:hypothetical protein
MLPVMGSFSLGVKRRRNIDRRERRNGLSCQRKETGTYIKL